jgi:ABC-2 type transport system ATP-binding protein
MSTHLLADVEHICDQVVVLDGGRLMHAGPLAGFSDAAPYVSVAVGPDGTAALAGALGRRGLTVHADTDHVVVDFHGDHTYDQIRDTVAELGLPLLRMARRRTSLADLFRVPSSAFGVQNDDGAGPNPEPRSTNPTAERRP